MTGGGQGLTAFHEWVHAGLQDCAAVSGTDGLGARWLPFSVQYHFHTPSEHALDGQRFAMEAHLVHKSLSTGKCCDFGRCQSMLRRVKWQGWVAGQSCIGKELLHGGAACKWPCACHMKSAVAMCTSNQWQ